MPWRKVVPGVEGVAQKSCKIASGGFDRFVQNAIAVQSEDFFRGRVEPTNNSLLVRRDDSRWNRFQKSFGEALLNGNLLVKQRVFEHRRDLLSNRREIFQIWIGEPLAGQAMAKKQPTDDVTARIKWGHHFGAKTVESAPKNRALPPFADITEIGTIDEMGVQLEPANERIALSKLQFLGLRQATQTGAEPITIAGANRR